jgi:hypothetical protein
VSLILNVVTNKERGRGFQVVLLSFATVLEVQQPSNGLEPAFKNSPKFLKSFMEKSDTLTLEVEDHMRRVFTIFNELVVADPEVFGNKYINVAKSFSSVG